MPLVFRIYSRKNWFFVNNGFTVNIISDTKQQFSCQISEIYSGMCLMVTIIYTKYDRNQRLEL